jgi:hypothetical protein
MMGRRPRNAAPRRRRDLSIPRRQSPRIPIGDTKRAEPYGPDRIYGSLVGRVTDDNDPEGVARVEVTVLHPVLGDKPVRMWCRLVAPGAGDERGLAFRPEVNHEVVIGFVDGDPRDPLVFGGLWVEAQERLGDDTDITIDDLCRSEPQRRADALCAALLAAAQAPGDGVGPLPTSNVLIDEITLEETVTGVVPEPGRYRDMLCRTQDGAGLDVSEAAPLVFWANLRRVIHDGAGVVIDLGRRQRLFTGSARDAALLLADRCSWPGCDRHVRSCQVDHSVGWKAHGATVPRNAGPMCGPHNRLKHRGNYTTHRDPHGLWTINDADGNSIG